MNGKEKCRILKQIRAAIAAQNDIDLVIEECPHKGDCLGTCPRCEEEVRFLEQELEKRRRSNGIVALEGIIQDLFQKIEDRGRRLLPSRFQRTMGVFDEDDDRFSGDDDGWGVPACGAPEDDETDAPRGRYFRSGAATMGKVQLRFPKEWPVEAPPDQPGGEAPDIDEDPPMGDVRPLGPDDPKLWDEDNPDPFIDNSF